MRLIDVDILYKAITDGEYTTGNIFKDMELQDFINEQPTVDAVEVVHGEWVIAYDEYDFARWHQCSVCGYELDYIQTRNVMKFCPNCGAKMDGGNNYE